MRRAEAERWTSTFAIDAARIISSNPSIYCGPASVAWIASVWNHYNGRPYELPERISDKTLFADGPRMFHGRVPGFQLSLNDLLLRETSGELRLDKETFFRADAIHGAILLSHMPVIVRITGPSLKHGLHYVTLFRSDMMEDFKRTSQFNFSLQDNGVFGNRHGLSVRKISSSSHLFIWGARRIMQS